MDYEKRARMVREYRLTKDAEKVAKKYAVTPRFICRLSDSMNWNGSLHVPKRNEVPTAEEMMQMDQLVLERPEITAEEIKKELKLLINEETVCKALKKLGYVNRTMKEGEQEVKKWVALYSMDLFKTVMEQRKNTYKK